jgi:hypothetical protein
MWRAEHVRLPKFYDRIEKAIRKVDANHILWLDGNTFAMDFKAFDSVLPNTVYAIHDYSVSLTSSLPRRIRLLGLSFPFPLISRTSSIPTDRHLDDGFPYW